MAHNQTFQEVLDKTFQVKKNYEVKDIKIAERFPHLFKHQVAAIDALNDRETNILQNETVKHDTHSYGFNEYGVREQVQFRLNMQILGALPNAGKTRMLICYLLMYPDSPRPRKAILRHTFIATQYRVGLTRVAKNLIVMPSHLFEQFKEEQKAVGYNDQFSYIMSKKELVEALDTNFGACAKNIVWCYDYSLYLEFWQKLNTFHFSRVAVDEIKSYHNLPEADFYIILCGTIFALYKDLTTKFGKAPRHSSLEGQIKQSSQYVDPYDFIISIDGKFVDESMNLPPIKTKIVKIKCPFSEAVFFNFDDCKDVDETLTFSGKAYRELIKFINNKTADKKCNMFIGSLAISKNFNWPGVQGKKSLQEMIKNKSVLAPKLFVNRIFEYEPFSVAKTKAPKSLLDFKSRSHIVLGMSESTGLNMPQTEVSITFDGTSADDLQQFLNRGQRYGRTKSLVHYHICPVITNDVNEVGVIEIEEDDNVLAEIIESEHDAKVEARTESVAKRFRKNDGDDDEEDE